LSQALAVEDLQILAAPLAVQPASKPTAKPTSTAVDKQALWTGLAGKVVLALKQITVNDGFKVNDVAAALNIDAQSLSIKDVKAGLNGAGQLNFGASLNFVTGDLPYRLKSDLVISEFNSAGLLGSSGSLANPTISAKFDINGAVAGSGANLEDLTQRLIGKFSLLSKGGTCSLLRSDAAEFLKPSSSSGALLSGLGSLLGGRAGVDANKVDEYMKSAAEIAEYCSNIPFDQLSVIVVRDDKLDIKLQDFSLISPMIRMQGSGEIRSVKGKAIPDQPLRFQLQMAARGKMAENLNKAKLLQTTKDELGYTPLVSPIMLGGTLANPDTSEFTGLLKKVAVSKAKDALMDRLLGK
jgi:hypothetical protein